MVEATRNTGIAGTAGRACGLLSLVVGTISVFRTVINDIDEVKSTLEISLTLFYYCGVVFAATLLRTAALVGAAKWAVRSRRNGRSGRGFLRFIAVECDPVRDISRRRSRIQWALCR